MVLKLIMLLYTYRKTHVGGEGTSRGWLTKHTHTPTHKERNRYVNTKSEGIGLYITRTVIGL